MEDANIEAFATKISLLIEDDELRKKMGKNARENVKVYETKIIAEKFYNLMTLLINK